MITSLIIALLIAIWIVLGLKANKANWGFWLTNVIDGWIRIYCRRFHRLEMSPIAIPSNGGAIIVANHASGVDPFVLIAATERPLHFLIAKEEYERFGLTWLFKMAGCIPVDRSGRVDKAFREVIRRINDGDVVALFPHGRIHLDHEEPYKIKPGLRKLAQKLSCPIYPARITGVRGAGDVFTGLMLPGKIRVEPLPVLNHEVFADPQIDQILGAQLLGRG